MRVPSRITCPTITAATTATTIMPAVRTPSDRSTSPPGEPGCSASRSGPRWRSVSRWRRAPSADGRAPSHPGWRPPSEQADDVAVGIDVDLLATWTRRKTRHRPHLAAQRRDEPRAGGEADLADRDREAGRPGLERRVVAERVLGLGHADPQMGV